MSLPFFFQETSESCVAACLRMVLAYRGIEAEEAALRECCQTTRLGTTFPDAAKCARGFGLPVDEVRDATWSDLQSWLSNDIYPILSVNLFPLEARWAAHAVVVEQADEQEIVYLDPLFGRRVTDRIPFEQAWQMRRSKAMLIGHA